MTEEQRQSARLEASPAVDRFEAERAALDRELLTLMAKRRDTFAREAAARIQAGVPVEASLRAHKIHLEQTVAEAAKLGLDPGTAERIFTALTTEGIHCFGTHTAALLSRPENTRVVMKTARQRGIPPEISTALFTALHHDDSVIADEREACDAAAVMDLLKHGTINNGFVRCALGHFEELAKLVELLTTSNIKIVGRAAPEQFAEDDEAQESILALAREVPKQAAVTTWWTWIFLRVPEGRSLRSTDLLIKALLTARHHRVDTSHIHSLPGLSYEGFSYSHEDTSGTHAARYRLSGSRSFLIDSRRSPSPSDLDRLISELVELGCFAQLICCVPLRRLPGVDHPRENPIQRTTTTLKT